MKTVDLTGQRFGRLVALRAVRVAVNLRTRLGYLVRCDCGTEKTVIGYYLTSGDTRSCGCLPKHSGLRHGNAFHGKRTPTYWSWQAMKARCLNPHSKSFPDYGGRGIRICDRWRDSFENFLADLGERPQGTTLDRINNSGNYEPGNCRWAVKVEQNRNQRPKHHLTATQVDEACSRLDTSETKLALELGVSRATITRLRAARRARGAA